jgi:hypothetical protein
MNATTARLYRLCATEIAQLAADAALRALVARVQGTETRRAA